MRQRFLEFVKQQPGSCDAGGTSEWTWDVRYGSARRIVIFCIEGSIEEIRGIMDSIEPVVVKVPLTVDVYRVRRQRIEFVGTWRYGNG